MRTLRPARATPLLLMALLGVVALLFTGCHNNDTNPGLGDGSATRTATPTASAPAELIDQLTGGRWYAAERGDPYLEFAADGALQGSDGCNKISTRWSADEDMIKVASFITTQKACSGVDPWLAKVSTLTLDDTTLTVHDAHGDTIGTLKLVEDE